MYGIRVGPPRSNVLKGHPISSLEMRDTVVSKFWTTMYRLLCCSVLSVGWEKKGFPTTLLPSSYLFLILSVHVSTTHKVRGGWNGVGTGRVESPDFSYVLIRTHPDENRIKGTLTSPCPSIRQDVVGLSSTQ